MGRGKNINFTQFHIAENDDGFQILCAFLGTATEGRGFCHITSLKIENGRNTLLVFLGGFNAFSFILERR